jgi:imidazolonepropionase-like amidohydrolase
MPGMVDAHCHLALDGSQLGATARAVHAKLAARSLAETGRRNARAAARCGVTLMRDAGDRHGVNHLLRAEARDPASGLPAIRSAGIGIKRAGRYGAFFAADVGDRADIVATVRRLAADSDEIKIVLTGIVDFEAGAVAGEPQFDSEEAALIARTARESGRRTLAHCSGASGLAVALAAGVDSIEHGFFITRETLGAMADKGIAWTPTLSPVHFQWARPEISGWKPQTLSQLRRILDQHAQSLRFADEIGVTILLGTDAGSIGTEHGRAVAQEIARFLEAGLSLESALRASTSAPRICWGLAPGLLATGAPFDAVLLETSPFDALASLQRVQGVYRAGMPLIA